MAEESMELLQKKFKELISKKCLFTIKLIPIIRHLYDNDDSNIQQRIVIPGN